MTEWYKEAFDEFYLEVYPHRDEKEARKFAAFLGKTVPLEGVRILDVCCGEGRHMRAFTDQGATCFGLDLSEALLKNLKAKRGGRSLHVARGDMRRFPFKDGSLDVCLSMFSSFGYFEDRREEQEVLLEASRVLRRGGTFVLDHANARWVRSNLEPHTVREGEGLLIEETRKLASAGNLIEKRTVIRSAEDRAVVRDYTERLALFSKIELEAMLKEAGFEVIGFCGGYDGSIFEEESSSRLVILARKVNV